MDQTQGAIALLDICPANTAYNAHLEIKSSDKSYTKPEEVLNILSHDTLGRTSWCHINFM